MRTARIAGVAEPRHANGDSERFNGMLFAHDRNDFAWTLRRAWVILPFAATECARDVHVSYRGKGQGNI